MPETARQTIRVGTASWSEPEFVRAGWYPKGLPAAQQLQFYAERFNLVELNSSFYALPKAAMCDRWVRITPEEFLIDVKCFRLLSRHSTKAEVLPPDLRGEAETNDRGNVILTPDLEREVTARFLAELKPLEQAGKLGAFLLQMTPGFSPRAADLTALETLVDQLKSQGAIFTRRVVLELRHSEWLGAQQRENTVAFARENRITLVSIDGPPPDAKHFTIMPTKDEITDGRLAYLRLHGRDANAYLTGKTVAERFRYDYTDREIDEVSERALHLAEQADEVHVIFNNNHGDFAPMGAERLRRKLGQGSQMPEKPRKQGELL